MVFEEFIVFVILELLVVLFSSMVVLILERFERLFDDIRCLLSVMWLVFKLFDMVEVRVWVLVLFVVL